VIAANPAAKKPDPTGVIREWRPPDFIPWRLSRKCELPKSRR
jgi:hypothetical protein